MRVFFRSFAVVVLALSLIASLTWAGTASNVASLVENPDSYQSQVVCVTGTVYNQTYDPVTNGATWLAPTTVLNARFARFNVTFDF